MTKSKSGKNKMPPQQGTSTKHLICECMLSNCTREEALEQERAAARALEEEGQGTELNMEGDEDSAVEEHNLDDDIPDADDAASEDWIDDDADEMPTEEGDGDYAEVSGLEGDMAGGRDLDDDVPEAGSYQHTDTDLEDETSSDDDTNHRMSIPGGISAAPGSSVFGSSPVAARRSAGSSRHHGRGD